MKTKIFILMLALCLLLCACGGNASGGTQQETMPSNKPTSDTSSLLPTTDESVPPTENIISTLPSSSILDPEIDVTLPFSGPISLPEDEFDDSNLGTLSSRPVNEPSEPLDDDTAPSTTPPVHYYDPGDGLPEDVFEE